MIQSGGGPRLSLKTFQRLMVAGEFFRQELKRNGATQLRILGLIDYPHAAATQFFENAVVRDGPIEGDVKRHFFSLCRRAADVLVTSSPSLCSRAFGFDRFCARPLLRPEQGDWPIRYGALTVVTAPLGFVELASVDGCTAGNHGPIGD